VNPFSLRLTFHGDLSFFLRSERDRTIERRLSERTSVKDAIESCGIPHSEVDLIVINGKPVDFTFVVEGAAEADIYPVDYKRVTLFPDNRLQAAQWQRFVADCHLGKLSRNLRLLGIDVAYNRAAEDRQLLKISTTDDRALLTRDRKLLMHAVVRHGYYVRSQDPVEQTVEVLQRFDLFALVTPFTRCLRCNASLAPIEKAKVFDQLEPLTRIYYEEFRRCAGCGQIYWRGSHFGKLEARIAKLKQQL
jgi:uncharacterized protein with PIN domain